MTTKKYKTTRKTAVMIHDSLFEDLVIQNKSENFFEYFSLEDVQAALNKIYNPKERNLMKFYEARSGDTMENVDLIRSSRLIYGAYEDEQGRIGVEGVITFRGNIKISKKMMSNLKAFMNENGIQELKVGAYYLQMGKRKSEPSWIFW